MLRILHTADWHLGHSLHDVPRRHEHARFLSWLLERLGEEQVDALLIAGDVFDSANPSAEAQQMLYDFLARACRQCPELDIIIIGGNHDSAARLDAPDSLLRALGIRVVGGLPRTGGRVIDVDRILIPLHDRSREVAALVAAVPFLRAFDLPPVDADDRLIAGVRRVYEEVLGAAAARRREGQALVAMGHCYMTGAAVSALSERKILGGNQHALPIDIFSDDVAYVALGHLHLAQAVGGREGVRYSGSPIPLSLAEASYCHQVCLVDLDGPALAGVRSLPVPRAVPILRIPEEGALPLEQLLPRLLALDPLAPDAQQEARPYLEVEVAVSRPEPMLRRSIEDALAGKAPRLMRLGVRASEGTGLALADARPTDSLQSLRPEEVFVLRYQRRFGGEPREELIAAFHELLDRVDAEAP